MNLRLVSWENGYAVRLFGRIARNVFVEGPLVLRELIYQYVVELSLDHLTKLLIQDLRFGVPGR